MAKHLTLFQTTSAYELFTTTDKFIKPNVSYCKDDCKVYYNPYKDYAKDYFTIENTGDDILSIVFKQFIPDTGDFLDSQVTISYRTTKSDWVETYEPINIEPHESIEIKANLRVDLINLAPNNCVMEGNTTCDIKGNIMSLLFGDDFIDKTDLTGYVAAFYTLFMNNQNIVSAENLILPATTLAGNCYAAMFYGCSNLTTAPELPATTLGIACYNGMFYGCSSLTTAPELPATTLADNCYSTMFYGCSNLTTAPELPATTLANKCYYAMFYDCTNLNSITVAFTEWDNGYTYIWVSGVATTGTFTCPADLPEQRGDDYIPEGWTIVRV